MLIPNYHQDIPEMAIEVACAAFPKGNRYMTIRDELGIVFNDKSFSGCYPSLGQPAAYPAGVAMGTVLQFMEDSMDIHQARYRGQARTHLQQLATAVAINLQRCMKGLVLGWRSVGALWNGTTAVSPPMASQGRGPQFL